MVPRCGEEIGGRTGAAIEEFIAAADREIRIGAVEVDRDRPRAVAEVPDDERAGFMRCSRDRGHVAHAARLVMNLGQQQHRSEEHTSELQSLMRISYAVFCLKKKQHYNNNTNARIYKHK